MQYSTLGRTGLKTSKLALGGLFVAPSVTGEKGGADAIRRALELGINYIDTAPGYGDSEKAIGEALKELGKLKKPLIISTKLGGRPTPFLAQDRKCLEASFNESLRLLGREQIDMLMIHEPDRPGQYDWWTDFAKAEGPVLDFLLELKGKGLVKHIGLGGTTVNEMTQLVSTGKFDVLLTAFNYSVLWREAELELLPEAKSQGMGVIVGSPLQQGALARKYEGALSPSVYWLDKARKEQFKRLYALSDDCGISVAEMALRFVVSNEDVHCILMGARSIAEVEENAAATERGALPEEILKKLREIEQLCPRRPFGEPFGLGWILGNPAKYKGPGKA